jgi:hypothetical protein
VPPDIRPYDRSTDLDAVERIWREVAWLDDDETADGLDVFLEGSHVEVGLLDGAPECSVCWVPGSIRYQHTDLPLCAVTAVTTSRIGRKQGFATTMTARAIRAGTRAGAAVAALGMFDQGFYDRLGFGSGPYEHLISFDPASLDLDHVPYRRPVRLSVDDHRELHSALATRHRPHGSVVLDSPAVVEAECRWTKGAFGLGYRNAGGRLTHFVFGSAKGEHGPYRVRAIAYQTPDQLLELLRLLAELGDQVTTVQMLEPAEIQLHDLIRTPLRRNTQTASSEHATGITSHAWLQLRILDVATCVAARHWGGGEVRFNISLTDPVSPVLEGSDSNEDGGGSEGGWSGAGGEWAVTVGAESKAEPGLDPALDTVAASVNAFSRTWFGVRAPSVVALTDDLSGPPELLAVLDEALALPPPVPGWDF